MKRAYAKGHDSHKPSPTQPAVPIVASGREIQLSLDRDELLGLMQDSLESLALKLGMLVASSLLEDEVTRLCGPRHERQPHRTHTRYGHQRGTATLAGQKIPIARPRVRRTDGGGEVPLETYARLQSPEAMAEAVLRRMVRGVSTRDSRDVIDLTRDGFGIQKSSVSRDFVRASAAQLKALAERRFDGTHFPVILIDGVEYAGETMIVAAGITADGAKRVLGLRQGATENAAVCVALLEDLQARGLDTSRPVLLVLDGARALHAAAKRVWGQDGVIQRRQVHKKRNVKAHVPREAPRRAGAAPLGGVPRDELRGRQGVAGGDGPLAGADQPGCGFEPPGGIGGDAGGGPAGPVGGITSDAGHDQSHRVGPLGDAPGESARDALA